MAFYKKDPQSKEILEATTLHNLKYILNIELKDNYIYPIDGWYWFNSKEEAYKTFQSLRDGN